MHCWNNWSFFMPSINMKACCYFLLWSLNIMLITVPSRYILCFIVSLYSIYQAMNRQHRWISLCLWWWLYFAGNSVAQAIDLLIRKGVPEDRIIFLNLISVYFFAYWMVPLLIICFLTCMTPSTLPFCVCCGSRLLKGFSVFASDFLCWRL